MTAKTEKKANHTIQLHLFTVMRKYDEKYNNMFQNNDKK